MDLAAELRRIEAARRAAEAALEAVEPPLLRAQLSVMVAQALIGASGFSLARDLPGVPPDLAGALRRAFAEADRANWALVDALKAARHAAEGG